jgi:diamine N-acetyltransferase
VSGTTIGGVHLREIEFQNLVAVMALGVTEAQSHHVGSVRASLGDAEMELDARPWYRAVYEGDTPVGFVMLSDNIPPGNPELLGPYYLWRLLIDKSHQGKGYGTQALDLCIEYLRTRPNAEVLFTSVVQDTGSALPFYLKYGFVETGDIVDDELVLRLPL